MASVSGKLSNVIASALSDPSALEGVDETERMKLLGALDKAQVTASLRIAQGMGVFDAFAATQGQIMKLSELNERTKGDQQLLSRILRVLCRANVIEEIEVDTFKSTPLTAMFSSGTPSADAVKMIYSQIPITANLYEYLKRNNFRNPEDAYQGPFQAALNTKDHFFEWLGNHPEDHRIFNNVMSHQGQRPKEWFEFFPVEQKLQVTSDKVTFVDMAGGIGNDLKNFRFHFQELPGRMILQDLPQVIDSIIDPLPDGVEVMYHDIFSPQPIKGAKAYYMRSVLHDWPDKQALAILGQIREAMIPESVLLLNEHTLPAANVPLYLTHLDFSMLETLSSLERTKQQWIDLLEKAGFKVVEVWSPGAQIVGSSALIEAVMA
ncbi:MAG: hypothetical protein M1822_006377 [Bathelium mastoideum]|nr:MAG: hypothetical protein M1822_006377 [Bathelium mastoideum]